MSQINLSYKLAQINSIGGQKAIWLTWSADIGAVKIYSAVDVVTVASFLYHVSIVAFCPHDALSQTHYTQKQIIRPVKCKW